MSKTLGGSTFVWNGNTQDYCYKETVDCLLELCDVVCIAAGGTDQTLEDVIEFVENHPKGRDAIVIPITKELWDSQQGREKLSFFSNLAISELENHTDYNMYIQCDEILHQDCFEAVRQAIETGEDAFLVTRFNLWGSPYTRLSVTQDRKPCSTEVIRLALTKYGCVGDAESLGVKYCTDKFLHHIRIYHLGFVRDRFKHLEKIRHIQDDVFLIDHDKRIDTMKETGFNPWAFFNPEDVIPIPEQLPIFIQQWAKERANQ